MVIWLTPARSIALVSYFPRYGTSLNTEFGIVVIIDLEGSCYSTATEQGAYLITISIVKKIIY